MVGDRCLPLQVFREILVGERVLKFVAHPFDDSLLMEWEWQSIIQSGIQNEIQIGISPEINGL